MIQNDTFFNVPIEDLFEEMEEEDENMLLRFLDENILLRKDLSEKKDSLVRKTETVNFTYDTFRDYLLAHYILDTLSENVEEQKTLIHKYTHDGHQLKEGIIPYLFVHAKNEENREIAKTNYVTKIRSLTYLDTFKKTEETQTLLISTEIEDNYQETINQFQKIVVLKNRAINESLFNDFVKHTETNEYTIYTK